MELNYYIRFMCGCMRYAFVEKNVRKGITQRSLKFEIDVDREIISDIQG